MNSKAKKSGSKLVRTETVTIRLDPKLRYIAELAARKHRRTLSSFIEWAIEQTLQEEKVYNEYETFNSDKTFFSASSELWDVDEVDRLIALASNYGHLLTHDEQVLFKIIKETNVRIPDNQIQFHDKHGFFDLPMLRACWAELKGVANGILPEDSLKNAMIVYYKNTNLIEA